MTLPLSSAPAWLPNANQYRNWCTANAAAGINATGATRRKRPPRSPQTGTATEDTAQDQGRCLALPAIP